MPRDNVRPRTGVVGADTTGAVISLAFEERAFFCLASTVLVGMTSPNRLAVPDAALEACVPLVSDVGAPVRGSFRFFAFADDDPLGWVELVVASVDPV